MTEPKTKWSKTDTTPKLRLASCLFLATIVGCLLPGNLAAQDERKTNAEYQKYAASLKEWKSIYLQIYELRERFKFSDESESEELQEKFRNLKKRGDEVAFETMDLGAAAFASLSTIDNDLKAFLEPLPVSFFDRHNYDKSWKIGEALMTKIEHDHALAFTTIKSAFCDNNFVVAKKYIEEWKKDHDHLPPEVQALDSLVDPLQEKWEKELKLREAEEKAGTLPRIQIDTDKGPIVVELFEDQAPIIIHNIMFTVQKTQTFQNMPFFFNLEHQFAMSGCPKGDGSSLLRMGDMTEEYFNNRRFPFRGTVSMQINESDNAVLTGISFNRIPMPDYEDRTLVIGRVIRGMEIVDNITNTHKINESGVPEADIAAKPDRLITTLIDRKPEGKQYDQFIEQRK